VYVYGKSPRKETHTCEKKVTPKKKGHVRKKNMEKIYVQKNLWRQKTHAKKDTQRHNVTTDKCKKSKKKRAKTVYAKETRIKKTHLTKKTY